MKSLEDFNNMNLAEAREAVAKYAKRANQRLRSLEEAGYEKASNAYRKVKSFSEDNRSFVDKTRKGEIKFRTTTKGRSLSDLKSELANLHTFLDVSKTSTPSAVKSVYGKAYETFTSSYGKDLSFSDYVGLWENAHIQKWVDMYGSQEVIRIIYRLGNLEMTKEERRIFLEQMERDGTLLSIYEEINDIEKIVGKKNNNEENSSNLFDTSNMFS